MPPQKHKYPADHCWKELMCCWMYLSNACFHPQSYLHYAHFMTLLCFWTYITEATEGLLLQSNASSRSLFSPSTSTALEGIQVLCKIFFPSCSHVWLQEERHQDITEQYNSRSIMVMNNGITQTKRLLVWTLCSGWLFISAFFPVYQYLPACIATGKKFNYVL